MRIWLSCLLVWQFATGGEVAPTPTSLAPRDLITVLAGLRTAYAAAPDAGLASARAIMANVGLCLSGAPDDFGSCGPWRRNAMMIAAERRAKRGGKPATAWAEAMPELWARLLAGAYGEVRTALAAVPAASRDLDWKVLNAYAANDAGTLRREDGPWAMMGLLWCGWLDPMDLRDPGLDAWQVQSTALARSAGHVEDMCFWQWVADVAWMLRSSELPEAEALKLLKGMASALGVSEAGADRNVLIRDIERASRPSRRNAYAVLGACFDALDRCLGGSGGMTATPRTLVGLGDVAAWLGDRSYRATYIYLRSTYAFREEVPSAPMQELMRTHGHWPIVARLGFDFDMQPRVDGARDRARAAIERALTPPACMSPGHLVPLIRMVGDDARGPELLARIEAAIEPGDTTGLSTSCDYLAADGGLGLFASRLRRAYADGNRHLPILWYSAWYDMEVINLPKDRGPDGTWIDPTIDNTTLPWPRFGESSNFMIRWTGWLRAPTEGTYLFGLTSDDGSDLRVNGQAVVRNHGMHGMQRHLGSAKLTAGWHPLVLDFYQGDGGGGCRLEWAPPGQRTLSAMPADAFAHGPAKEPGLDASGFRMPGGIPAQPGDQPWPERLLAAAAEQPENLSLQNALCKRAAQYRRPLDATEAAQRIAKLAKAGRLNGKLADPRWTSQMCDSALTVLLHQPTIDPEGILAVLPHLEAYRYIPPGSYFVVPGILDSPADRYSYGLAALHRYQQLSLLLRQGLAADPRTLKALLTRACRDPDSGSDGLLEGTVALAAGDLRQAWQSLGKILAEEDFTCIYKPCLATGLMQWTLLERMFSGREPARDQVAAALDRLKATHAQKLAWSWISGEVSWAEALTKKEATEDGNELLGLRGLYLITLGQFAEAEVVLKEYNDHRQADISTALDNAWITALPRLAAQKLPVAKPLPKDGEVVVPKKPASGSDF